MLKIKKKTVNIWEYKVGNNANMANFCAFVKIPNENVGSLDTTKTT